MAQETKAKSEDGKENNTIYGQDGQAPLQEPAAGQPQGAPYSQVNRTIYGQDIREDSQRAVRQPQGEGGQVPRQRMVRQPQGEGSQMPPQRMVRQPQGREGQIPQQRMARQPQGEGSQMPPRRMARQPQGEGSQMPPRRMAGQAQGREGQIPQQRMAGQAQGQGSQMPPQRVARQPQGQRQGNQVRRTVYGQQDAQRQPQRMARQPYAQGGQMPPQRMAGQPRRAVYDQNGRPQNGAPYGQMGDPGRPEGAFVRRGRAGNVSGRMMPRQGMTGRRIMEQSRKMFHSPVFLVIALLCTVSAVTTIASVFLQDLSFSQVVNILANFDAPSELMAYANKILSFMSNLGSGMIVVSLLLHLPELLLCIGLLILFVTAGKKERPMPGTGFSCTKIYIIIKMIIMCAAMLVCLILSVVFAMSAWMSVNQGTKVLSAIFLVAMIVITMMVIMYFFCLLHTVRVCRANAVQGENFSSVSRYAAVLTILVALGSILGLLSAIVNAETAGIVSFACKIGWMVLAGLWILLYRNKIKDPAEEE